MFAFAGLMSRWKAAKSDAAILTAAIMTRAAVGTAADVHDRMPVILPKKEEEGWLDMDETKDLIALFLALTESVTEVVHYPVSSRVNNSRSQGAELIEPYPNPA